VTSVPTEKPWPCGKLKLRGGNTLLVAPVGNVTVSRPRPDQALIAGLRRGHAELRRHNVHLRKSDGNLAEARGIDDPYLRRLASLAFLAPDIQRAILDGRHPMGLKLQQLVTQEIPLYWQAQRIAFGFSGG
jgi:site-specific DNA recombinase